MRRKEEDKEIPSPSQGPASAGVERNPRFTSLPQLGEGVREGTGWDMFSSTTHSSNAG